ncbi:BZ3500_MvSof-1268-A1-R1_Chr4-3g07370 [Microbotryum saponariae]|uniref:BZ3500_MvSof-1268-A1-R1_Chr4-3g07370 protein n=1 Tax=Microbotryum saponariae TaxID=289078 RepID=A0A2X0MZC7_9BASI|nr:BZ3500_MvSof-1268-A1-R1_Chr4-3g07370 [Microbotryum saponariae]SDA07033.1 BZ3501_MvSof-1269-A2-R1_Chr4-2g07079 [Microbotryum saponariae]
MHLRTRRTAVPSVLSDLLAFKFPSNAYRFVPRDRITVCRPTTHKPSALLGHIKFRRSPGETLPRHALTSASPDPSLVCQVLLRQLLHHWPVTLNEWDDSNVTFHLLDLMDITQHTVSRLTDRPVAIHYMPSFHKYLGQDGLPTLHTSVLDGDEFANTVVLETNNVGNLESAHESYPGLQMPNLWSDYGSGTPLDLRVFDSNGRSVMHSKSKGIRLAKMALQLHQHKARFGVHFAPPYFVLCELVVENGRTHLLTNEVCSSVLWAQEDLAPVVAPRPESLFAILVSLFSSVHADYSIEGPPEKMRIALRQTTDELESIRLTPLLSPPIETLDSALACPFLVHAKALEVTLRHLPGTAIICDSEANKDTGMVAIGVELDCEGDVNYSSLQSCIQGHFADRESLCYLLQFFSVSFDEEGEANVLPWITTPIGDPARLDRLDLLTEIGRGRTATTWTTRWSGRPDTEVPRASAASDPPARLQGDLVAKVVSADYYAPSIAREYFIFTQVVPSLSTAAQAYFPKFHGLYRSGSDGRAYVLLLEDVGSTVTQEQWVGDTELRRKIEKEGVYHGDERAQNVAIRPDGRICIIDWGEALFARQL